MWANRSLFLLSKMAAPSHHQTSIHSGRIFHSLGYFCDTQFIVIESNILNGTQNNPLTSIRSVSAHFHVLAWNVRSENSCSLCDIYV